MGPNCKSEAPEVKDYDSSESGENLSIQCEGNYVGSLSQATKTLHCLQNVLESQKSVDIYDT